MGNREVTAEELKAALAEAIDQLAEQMAAAMNEAQAGQIIADSEEAVRDAHASFRQQAFERAVRLLQDKQEAFSPSAPRAEEQRPAEHNPSND